MVVSERWTARPALLGAAELFGMTGSAPFALLYGDGPRGRWLVFADSPLALIESPDASRIAFERSGRIPPIRPDFIGFASYEWGCSLEPLLPPALPSAFPAFRFAVYGRIAAFDRAAGLLYESRREVSGTGAPPFAGEPHSLAAGPFSARKTDDDESPASYAGKVSAIREEIASGNVYQANLTRRETWAFDGDLRSFALALYRENPAPYSAMIAWPDCAIVSSSPERLIGIADGRIEARPIKGTVPRGTTPELDRALRAGLLESAKDRSELAMIVDLLRNDLTRACVIPSVRVDAFPEAESYANVHHLVATVSGELRPGLGLDGLLRAVFPGGSVTGCPKIAAMRLIRALEPSPREIYTGALGWFSADLKQLDLNIPIRTAWTTGPELRFGVGGAVVWDSDPAAEYEESVHKGRSMVRCLSSR